MTLLLAASQTQGKKPEDEILPDKPREGLFYPRIPIPMGIQPANQLEDRSVA